MLAPGTTPMPQTARLTVRSVLDAVDVERRYRNGRGVGPMTLHVTCGERVAVMGPNGAGKTTLLRILATGVRPRRGVVRWYGTTSPRRARRLLGFAPDVIVEEGALSARQSTYFWCRQWMSSVEAGGFVDDALTQFGLHDVADEPVSSFSFGMRRRLGLAQALVHRPRLALLDEPTAGLDPEGVDSLIEALRERAQRGHPTIIATNDCDFVGAACDRVLFLDDGALVWDAAPSELLQWLGSRRVAELEVPPQFSTDALQAIDGVGDISREDGIVRLELLDDRALADVVTVADGSAGGLHGLRLHTPDLGDAFRNLTGRSLRARKPDTHTNNG